MLLSVEGLNVFHGEAIHALRDVSFVVPEGEIVSIIGANGAGKSTLMWTLAGLYKPKSGSDHLSRQAAARGASPGRGRRHRPGA